MVGGDVYWSSVGSQLGQCPRISFHTWARFSFFLGTQKKCREASSAGEHGGALLGSG